MSHFWTNRSTTTDNHTNELFSSSDIESAESHYQGFLDVCRSSRLSNKKTMAKFSNWRFLELKLELEYSYLQVKWDARKLKRESTTRFAAKQKPKNKSWFTRIGCTTPIPLTLESLLNVEYGGRLVMILNGIRSNSSTYSFDDNLLNSFKFFLHDTVIGIVLDVGFGIASIYWLIIISGASQTGDGDVWCASCLDNDKISKYRRTNSTCS